jgi:hypothetical protein
MAFIIEDSSVISFAEYQDVLNQDSRLFESNESLTDDIVEDALIRSTQRILARIKNTDWWQDLYVTHTGSVNRLDIPNPDPDKIQARQDDFTDLCVFTALAERILPSIADFGDEDNAERRKMGYYENRATELFMEIVNAGDWYDFDGDATIQTDEKRTGNLRLMRIR